MGEEMVDHFWCEDLVAHRGVGLNVVAGRLCGEIIGTRKGKMPIG